MKKINQLVMVMTVLLSFHITNCKAQQSPVKKATFKVYGNCEMCQSTIEGALKKKDGVVSKSWDTETKMLTVSYDTTKITITAIKQKIADVGYDTDEIRAKTETYNKLHKCCQYDRPKN